jgi:hypothetical protein
MKVGVAHTAGFGLYQYLAGAGCRDVNLHEHQRFAETLDERRLHFFRHNFHLLFLLNYFYAP